MNLANGSPCLVAGGPREMPSMLRRVKELFVFKPDTSHVSPHTHSEQAVVHKGAETTQRTLFPAGNCACRWNFEPCPQKTTRYSIDGHTTEMQSTLGKE